MEKDNVEIDAWELAIQISNEVDVDVHMEIDDHLLVVEIGNE